MKVADFGDLTKAEAGLIAHLQGGGAWDFEASEGVPPKDAPADLHIRASLIRALILKKIEDCALPERGLRTRGAYILGDGDTRGENRGLDLEGASIDCDLALLSCRFANKILLRNAQIKNLFLNGSALDNALSADGLTVKGNVLLRKVEAAGEIRLLGATIGGDLGCIGAKLIGTGDALLADRLDIKGSVFLREVEAAGGILLVGAMIGGNLECEAVKLNATGRPLIADGATIAGAFFWRDGALSKGAIDLTAATIGTINDAPACWPDELVLDRCRYGAFTGFGVSGRERIDWLSRMKPKKYGYDFWPQPYEECARALREAGHGSDAREVLIEKERLQRKAWRAVLQRQLDAARAGRDAGDAGKGFRPENDKVVSAWLRLWWARFVDWLLEWSVAFGRRPGRAAIWLLLALGLGAMIFARAAGFGEIKPNLPQIQRAPEWVACAENPDLTGLPEAARGPYTSRARPGEDQLICFLRQPEAASYPRFNALVYSADTLLPVIAMEMQSYWIPDDSKPIGRWARLYLWLHIAAGWGLTLLAVAGFSGLIKTDNTK